MPQKSRIFPRFIKYSVSVLQNIFGQFGICQYKKRRNIHLRIPEIMPFIALSRKPLGRNAAMFITCRGLKKLIHVKIHSLTKFFISVNFHFGIIKKSRDILFLLLVNISKITSHGFF